MHCISFKLTRLLLYYMLQMLLPGSLSCQRYKLGLGHLHHSYLKYFSDKILVCLVQGWAKIWFRPYQNQTQKSSNTHVDHAWLHGSYSWWARSDLFTTIKCRTIGHWWPSSMPCSCLPDERQPASFISTRLDLDRAITAHPHVSGPSALEPRGRGIAPRFSFNHSQILHRAGCLRSHSERLSLVDAWMAVSPPEHGIWMEIWNNSFICFLSVPVPIKGV